MKSQAPLPKSHKFMTKVSKPLPFRLNRWKHETLDYESNQCYGTLSQNTCIYFKTFKIRFLVLLMCCVSVSIGNIFGDTVSVPVQTHFNSITPLKSLFSWVFDIHKFAIVQGKSLSIDMCQINHEDIIFSIILRSVLIQRNQRIDRSSGKNSWHLCSFKCFQLYLWERWNETIHNVTLTRTCS